MTDRRAPQDAPPPIEEDARPETSPGIATAPGLSGGLARRAGRAAALAFGLKLSLLLGSLIEKVILARLLTPEDFGLIGMCLLVITLLEVLSETGFLQALIHERTVGRAELDAAWTVSIVRGFVVAAIVFALAEPISAFFGEPRVAELQRWLALVFVLYGFQNPGMVMFRRELAYRPTVLQQGGAMLAELIVGVVLAIVFRSVWALVVATLVRYAAMTVLSHVLASHRPRPTRDLATMRHLFRYGRWITASGIVTYMVNNADNTVIGRILGASPLGLYSMAFTLSNLPATQITNVLGDVAFPTYVKVRDAGGSVGRAYLRVLEHVTFFSLPVAGGLFVLGPELVRVALGSKWEPMIPALQVLCAFGLVRSIGANSGPAFQALGRPDLAAKTATLRLIAMGALLVPMTNAWGIEGAAWAVLAGAVLAAPVTYALTIRLTACGVAAFARTVATPLAATVAMVVALELLAGALPFLERGWALPLQVVAGVAVHAAASLLLSRVAGLDAGERIYRVLVDGVRNRRLTIRPV